MGADQGYAAERVYKDAGGRVLATHIPPQRTMLSPAASAPRTEAERERCKTQVGIWAYKRRMANAEGVIGELKLQHGLGRARYRGTPLFYVQVLLGRAAINLKRLARHAPQAASGGGRCPNHSIRHPAHARSDRLGLATACRHDPLYGRNLPQLTPWGGFRTGP